MVFENKKPGPCLQHDRAQEIQNLTPTPCPRLKTALENHARSSLQKDADYCREYGAWILSLSPVERAKVEALGIGTPHLPKKISKALPVDERRLADTAGFDPYNEPEAEPRETYSRAEMLEVMRQMAEYAVGPCGTAQPKAALKRALVAGFELQLNAGLLVDVENYSDIARLCGLTAQAVSQEALSFRRIFGVNLTARRTPEQRARRRASSFDYIAKNGGQHAYLD